MLLSPCLMLVTDRRRCGAQGLRSAVATAVDAGVDAVQLREKDLSAGQLYDLALELRVITKGHCVFLVNDRLDVALAANADGVHLPETGLPIHRAKQLCPSGFLIGRSVHSAASAVEAALAGASYVELGTIFETASKPGLAPAGVHLVRETTLRISVPCVAIGGIEAANTAAVLEAGASGIAVVSAVLQAPDVALAVRDLRRALAAVADDQIEVNAGSRIDGTAHR